MDFLFSLITIVTQRIFFVQARRCVSERSVCMRWRLLEMGRVVLRWRLKKWRHLCPQCIIIALLIVDFVSPINTPPRTFSSLVFHVSLTFFYHEKKSTQQHTKKNTHAQKKKKKHNTTLDPKQKKMYIFFVPYILCVVFWLVLSSVVDVISLSLSLSFLVF